MELRYQMTDILPLLPIPQPPHGRSAYNIKIDDDHIADIIQGRPTILPQEVRDVIFAKVRLCLRYS